MNLQQLGYLRAAAANLEVSIGDPAKNSERVLRQAQLLHDQGVAVAVFPELALSGYSAEDLFFSEHLHQALRQALIDIAKANPLPLLVVGTPWQTQDGRLMNCAAVFGGHRLLGMVPKSVNPNHGEFYDLRWFTNAQAINETIIDPDFGPFQLRVDQLFKVEGVRVGVEICEDL